jgi:hypothetical protein
MAEEELMMKKNNPTAFWTQGFSIFNDDLAKQEKALITPLKKEMKETHDPDRKAQLMQDIEVIKAEFRIKRKNARYSLFMKT